MYKKILASVLLFALLAVSLVRPTSALADPGPWWGPTHAEFNAKVNGAPDGEIFGERYTHAQVWWIVYSLINLAFGTSTMQCAAAGSNAGDAEAGAVAYISCLEQNGVTPPEELTGASLNPDKPGDWGMLALARMSDQMLSTKPASGVLYVTNVAQKIIGVPEAVAQEGGYGFNSLQPLQNIWGFSRNAAYALMTLAVVVLAFMIMFRMRISPQASVTVMSAIPRIIIGLILITFSFAIAGFIIDLAFVIQGIISALVAPSNLISDVLGSQGNITFLFNRMNDVTTGIVSYGFLTIGVAFVLLFIPSVGLAGVTGGLSILAGLLILLVVLILFMIALVKIFWLLLRTYVMIIFHIIALPFTALGYVAYPSSNPFMSLLRSFVGQVSVFVTVSFVVMFAHLVAWNMASDTWGFFSSWGMLNPYRAATGGFSGTLGLPAFGGGAGDANMLALFVGLVILLMAASVANNVKSLIISGRTDPRAGGMLGGGFLGGVARFMGAQAQQGIMGEAGFQLARRGVQMQRATGRFAGIQKGIGRGLTAFGESQSSVLRDRDTGQITGIARKGTETGHKGQNV